MLLAAARSAVSWCGAQLVERFGGARDEWIKEDLASWLAPNRIYDGVADALRQLKEREDVYIVTTKQVCCPVRSRELCIPRRNMHGSCPLQRCQCVRGVARPVRRIEAAMSADAGQPLGYSR